MSYITAKRRKLYIKDQEILLRGFGLGGWLLPEGYMWKLFDKCDRPRRMEAMIETLCGQEYAKQFWKQYYDNYITYEDIKFIAEQGFNSVRLPLNARNLFIVKDGKISLQEKTIYHVDNCIRWSKQEGIYVILDMHAAFGGQTGQNIDDSEDDKARLFMDELNQELLIQAWELLAARYNKETTVAGYDLLNEPLPNWNSQYNDMLLPLYRKLIKAIRRKDKKHLIILEGLHWATDFSVFDNFTKEEASDNIMLQFHKYWNTPDVESIKPYIQTAHRLEVPLFMGEGGENNCDWYTAAFPMFERNQVSWSFWSYKKMECTNSPITFPVPMNWSSVLQWIDGEIDLSSQDAIIIFDDFIKCIQTYKINSTVINALKRMAPTSIPSEAYDCYDILWTRQPGADIRLSEPVTVLFSNGKKGEVNYQRYGGEPQPETENLVVKLKKEDKIGYYFYSSIKNITVKLTLDGKGSLGITCGINQVDISIVGPQIVEICLECNITKKNELYLRCTRGMILLDVVELHNDVNRH